MLCHEDTLSCYLKINTLNLKNADPCVSRVRQCSTLKRLLLFLYKVISPNRFSDSCLSRTARQLQQSVQVTFHFDQIYDFQTAPIIALYKKLKLFWIVSPL